MKNLRTIMTYFLKVTHCLFVKSNTLFPADKNLIELDHASFYSGLGLALITA